MHLALYCPDIAQNAGTCLRMGACLGIPVHIIEPAGFPVGNAAFRRAGMDYLDAVEWRRHDSFADFETFRQAEGRRLILFTTAGTRPYTNFRFDASDILLFGRESAGVPQNIHDLADERLTIPMRPGMRSLNIAMSAAMAAGEALRQTNGFPRPL
ncbi:tRNA (cytidine(34)-2'-O)-methyltransferase [Xanthobacter sp. TB0136]|uniref:tRNA (cytidine(34)-2'-O)-methyltransferase n=1 Tax=Xanthobacter sp. TB0136 TaxID=3459177 RepID=UPI00403A37ED